MTTIINVAYISLKWNKYLNNLEFNTLSPKLYTFWRINSSDVSLQYQHGDFEYDLIDPIKGVFFTCLEYSPPLSINCVILLLVALSTGEIWGIDTKTNSVNIKFNQNMTSSYPIKGILCSLKFISVISSNVVKYYKLPFLKDIKYDDLNLFVNKEEEITVDSEIVSFDLDLMVSNGIVLTKKSSLYCINYEEKIAFRIFSFIEENSEIIQAKIINKDYQYYSLRKIDFDNLEIEQISPEIKENQYFLITSLKGGLLKIWSIPEYSLAIKFEIVTEEIICFDSTPNDLKIVVSYNSGLLRFFDIGSERFLGKYKSISGSPYKCIQFLPDGQYLFCIDFNNTVFLINVKNYEPLLVQIHQLFNIAGEILDFKISLVETYNKFLVNVQNVYLQVYNRKFTNILKNLSFDSSVPVFYLQDKFHVDDYLKNNYTQDNLSIKSSTPINENFCYDFSPNTLEKTLIYILSVARKLILIRNYELHTINKVITFTQFPSKFSIVPNCAYIAYMFTNHVKLSQLGEEIGIDIKFPFIGKNITISINGKLLIIYSDKSILFYNINYI